MIFAIDIMVLQYTAIWQSCESKVVTYDGERCSKALLLTARRRRCRLMAHRESYKFYIRQKWNHFPWIISTRKQNNNTTIFFGEKKFLFNNCAREIGSDKKGKVYFHCCWQSWYFSPFLSPNLNRKGTAVIDTQRVYARIMLKIRKRDAEDKPRRLPRVTLQWGLGKILILRLV